MCVSVYARMYATEQGEVCDLLCVCLGCVQGCGVGSFLLPDELAGICKRWITRQQESIIQKGGGGEKEKKKKRNVYPAPAAPGSLFQFREWFSQNAEGKGREEKRSSLEGVRVGWWGVEAETGDGMKTSVCDSSPFSSFIPSLFLPADLIQEAKCSVKMQNAIIRTSESTNATVWWMSVGFRKTSCPTSAVSTPQLSFSLPVSCIQTILGPWLTRPKQKTFVINWVE